MNLARRSTKNTNDCPLSTRRTRMRFNVIARVVAGVVFLGALCLAQEKTGGPGVIPDPKQGGGEAGGVVQVANLIYAGTKTSKCFADHFLAEAEKVSTISTSKRFHTVKLSSEEMFEFPLVIMTGE